MLPRSRMEYPVSAAFEAELSQKYTDLGHGKQWQRNHHLGGLIEFGNYPNGLCQGFVSADAGFTSAMAATRYRIGMMGARIRISDQ